MAGMRDDVQAALGLANEPPALAQAVAFWAGVRGARVRMGYGAYFSADSRAIGNRYGAVGRTNPYGHRPRAVWRSLPYRHTAARVGLSPSLVRKSN